MNKTLSAHLSLLGANVIFGLNYILSKDVVAGYFSPLAFTLLRVTGAVILFWVLGFFMPREKIDRSDIPRLIIASFMGVSLNQLIFLTALKFGSAIDASILMTLNPVMVLLIAAIWTHENITSSKIWGIVIGASGALLLIIMGGKSAIGFGNFWGNILMLLNCLLWALFLVIAKPLMVKYKSVTVMKWEFLVGLFIILPFSFDKVFAIKWDIIPGYIIWEFFYVVIFATFLGYLLNMYGLKFVKPVSVSVYIYAQPVFAAFFAIILGKDALSMIDIIAAFLVFLGVYIVGKQGKGLLPDFKAITFKNKVVQHMGKTHSLGKD